jgi:hypothetical protein
MKFNVSGKLGKQVSKVRETIRWVVVGKIKN